MKELSLPVGPAELLRYFEAVAQTESDPYWRKGVEMCQRWLKLAAGPVSQGAVDEFLDELKAERNPGSGWLDLGMQFRAWARDRGFKV